MDSSIRCIDNIIEPNQSISCSIVQPHQNKPKVRHIAKVTMALKPLSIFVVFFIFLVISDVPEIEAQDSQCLREYGGDVGFSFCAPRILPTFCYTRCRENKGAKGGRCRWGPGTNVRCLCDYCNDKP
ncbi:BnaC04g52990D [Brassica napus]|nr:unnamed protein product [Brassica napus]CDY58529.1 BnaC04g52990D [Brassica napus]VDD04592.1 unnamed protein product [Brassica oleracea]